MPRTAKSKRPPRMTAKAALGVVDAVLSRCDHEAQALWQVLTALRGPDNTEDAGVKWVKRTATEHIRAAALPRTAARLNASRNLPLFEVAIADISPSCPWALELPMAEWHLGGHLSAAKAALEGMGRDVEGQYVPVPVQR